MARFAASPVEIGMNRRDLGSLRHRLTMSWESATWPFLAISVAYGLTVNRLIGMGCPFHDATGLDCPGCGATRACFNLLHGRVVTALHYNALAVVAGATLLPAAILARVVHLRPPRWIIQSRLARHPVFAVVVVGVVWTAFRNLPAFHWFNTSWAQR